MEGEERGLVEIATTGRRRQLRGTLFALAALPGLLALALLPFAGHSRGDHFVDTLTAASNVPLVIGIFIEVALLFAWRGRLRRTVIVMPLAALAAALAWLTTAFHGSTQITPVSNDAEAVAEIAFAVAALMCGVVFVAEFMLVAAERARPADELPPARVINR